MKAEPVLPGPSADVALLVPLIVGVLLVVCDVTVVSASEFPDRECCDQIFPLAAISASVTPDTSAAATPGTETVVVLHAFLARGGFRKFFSRWRTRLQSLK